MSKPTSSSFFKCIERSFLYRQTQIQVAIHKQFGDNFPVETDYRFQTIFNYSTLLINESFETINDWDFRQVAFSNYKAGFEIRTTRLCKRVLLFHFFNELPGGSALIKSTNFEYDTTVEQDFTFFKHDLPDKWHLLKKYGTVGLVIVKSRMPYMVQSLEAKIETNRFVIDAAENPPGFTITVDGTANNLARIDEWRLCTGVSNDIEINTAFNLSVAGNNKEKLQDLLMVLKYHF